VGTSEAFLKGGEETSKSWRK